VRYSKPHLTYEALVDHVSSRGLICSDRSAAIALVGQVGYYRLSAYAYPFRELMPDSASRDSPYKFRLDTYVTGAKFEDAIALYRFDRKLRSLLLEGLEALEVGLRVRLAQILGARDPFGHVSAVALDEKACSETDRRGVTALDSWLERYEDLKQHAKGEDYVAHFIHKYDSYFPVWVAVEFLDFGALVRLFKLLKPQDQNAIAAGFGVKAGKTFGTWLLTFSYLRNLAAHHSRVWNRNLTYKVGKFPATIVGTELAHVAATPASTKLYRSAAVLAYCLRSLNPASSWPSAFRTQLRKFPHIAVVDVRPEVAMGFPDAWDAQPVWRPSTS
jgi:abortive infection bacteriophage resistance protein